MKTDHQLQKFYRSNRHLQLRTKTNSEFKLEDRVYRGSSRYKSDKIPKLIDI